MFIPKELLPIVFVAISVFVIILFLGLILGKRMAERDNLRTQNSLVARAADTKN